MSYSTLLSVVGRIRPEAWDAIVPHGPHTRVTRAEMAGLNPQPLPPVQAFLVDTAEMTHELVRAAVGDEMRGGSSSGVVSEIIDDWCGTPWPRKWPWPGPGPRPGSGRRGPTPEPWDLQTARVIGAIIFASVASRLDEGDLKEAFASGADRLTEAALAD